MKQPECRLIGGREIAGGIYIAEVERQRGVGFEGLDVVSCATGRVTTTIVGYV